MQMRNTRMLFIMLCFFVVVCLIACPSGEEGENCECKDEIPFPDKVWCTAHLIEMDSDWAENPQVGVDGSGSAIAVWQQWDGTVYVYSIRANLYVPCTGWGTAQLIETDSGAADNPQVGVNGSGNAVAVWDQYDEGIRWNIWANSYTEGIGWGDAELIETDNSGSAENPQVGIDGSGNAIAVWWQSDGTWKNIWANRYVAGTGWGDAELIETDDSDNALNPQVGVNGSGNAIAVWYQSDGTWWNIWSNSYVAGIGWGDAELLETDNSGHAGSPQVGIDGSGNAVAVWYQDDGTWYNIWANRYVAGTGWGDAELIETDDKGDAYGPQVGIDGSGNAIAVWWQSDGTRYNIWANRYVAGTGWGDAELIETDNSGDAEYPQVGIDESGNAVAVWRQSDGAQYNIWANCYVVGTGWGDAELIETDNSGDARHPQVGVDGSGNAIAVWYQSDGTQNDIWYNTRR
jgi:hypothetical protein